MIDKPSARSQQGAEGIWRRPRSGPGVRPCRCPGRSEASVAGFGGWRMHPAWPSPSVAAGRMASAVRGASARQRTEARLPGNPSRASFTTSRPPAPHRHGSQMAGSRGSGRDGARPAVSRDAADGRGAAVQRRLARPSEGERSVTPAQPVPTGSSVSWTSVVASRRWRCQSRGAALPSEMRRTRPWKAEKTEGAPERSDRGLALRLAAAQALRHFGGKAREVGERRERVGQGVGGQPRRAQPEPGQGACAVDGLRIRRGRVVTPVLPQDPEVGPPAPRPRVDEPILTGARVLVLVELVTAIAAHAVVRNDLMTRSAAPSRHSGVIAPAWAASTSWTSGSRAGPSGRSRIAYGPAITRPR